MTGEVAVTHGLAWRAASLEDLDTIMSIQVQVHELLPEREEIVAEKITLFPEGCRMLVSNQTSIGYAIAHPWTLDSATTLDGFLGAIPVEADCIYLHDVAILPEGRGHGAGKTFVAYVSSLAKARGIRELALVSVYGTVGTWGACGFRVKTVPSLTEKLAPYGAEARYMTMHLG